MQGYILNTLFGLVTVIQFDLCNYIFSGCVSKGKVEDAVSREFFFSFVRLSNICFMINSLYLLVDSLTQYG